MVVNLHHGPTVPTDSQFTMNIRFDDTIQSILELDRLTGQQVVLTVPANHQLSVLLPAGMGRLFKSNDGDFLLAQVPEPATYGLWLIGCFLSVSFAGWPTTTLPTLIANWLA